MDKVTRLGYMDGDIPVPILGGGWNEKNLREYLDTHDKVGYPILRQTITWSDWEVVDEAVRD